MSVRGQPAGIIQHPPLQTALTATLDFDQKSLPVMTGTDQVENGPSYLIGIARMLIFTVHQVGDLLASTKHFIQKCNKQVFVWFRSEDLLKRKSTSGSIYFPFI